MPSVRRVIENPTLSYGLVILVNTGDTAALEEDGNCTLLGGG